MKVTKMPREPKIGDAYFPVLASDYKYEQQIPGQRLTIVKVEPYGDNETCCNVTADDGCGYDCMWSDRFQTWVYNSEGES